MLNCQAEANKVFWSWSSSVQRNGLKSLMSQNEEAKKNEALKENMNVFNEYRKSQKAQDTLLFQKQKRKLKSE